MNEGDDGEYDDDDMMVTTNAVPLVITYAMVFLDFSLSIKQETKNTINGFEMLGMYLHVTEKTPRFHHASYTYVCAKLHQEQTLHGLPHTSYVMYNDQPRG